MTEVFRLSSDMSKATDNNNKHNNNNNHNNNNSSSSSNNNNNSNNNKHNNNSNNSNNIAGVKYSKDLSYENLLQNSCQRRKVYEYFCWDFGVN